MAGPTTLMIKRRRGGRSGCRSVVPVIWAVVPLFRPANRGAIPSRKANPRRKNAPVDAVSAWAEEGAGRPYSGRADWASFEGRGEHATGRTRPMIPCQSWSCSPAPARLMPRRRCPRVPLHLPLRPCVSYASPGVHRALLLTLNAAVLTHSPIGQQPATDRR